MSHLLVLLRRKFGQKGVGFRAVHTGYIKYPESFKKYLFKSYDGKFPETWGYHSYIVIN